MPARQARLRARRSAAAYQAQRSAVRVVDAATGCAPAARPTPLPWASRLSTHRRRCPSVSREGEQRG